MSRSQSTHFLVVVGLGVGVADVISVDVAAVPPLGVGFALVPPDVPPDVEPVEPVEPDVALAGALDAVVLAVVLAAVFVAPEFAVGAAGLAGGT